MWSGLATVCGACPWLTLAARSRHCLAVIDRSGQRVVDHANERLERLRAGEHAAVDEERRGAGHVQPLALLDVLLNRRPVFSARDALLEGRHVETRSLGDGRQLVRLFRWSC